MLFALTAQRPRMKDTRAGWTRACYLVCYAVPFSLAYVQLRVGTGALLLFGGVQLTMILLGLGAGERPGALAWLSLLGAAGGVVYLVYPGVTAPDPLAALLMIVAGVSWGFYSIAGKSAGDPAVATADAFRRAAAIVVPVTALAYPYLSLTPRGALLAVLSGALASGCGYVAWYSALCCLSATDAALVQLAVPALTAAGGVVFLSEAVSVRLAVASAAILGSIAIGVAAKRGAARVG